MAYKWGLVTTYTNWNDPPSRSLNLISMAAQTCNISAKGWPIHIVKKWVKYVDGWNPAPPGMCKKPVNKEINCLSTGAGFLPGIVYMDHPGDHSLLGLRLPGFPCIFQKCRVLWFKIRGWTIPQLESRMILKPYTTAKTFFFPTTPIRSPTSVKRANGTHPCLPTEGQVISFGFACLVVGKSNMVVKHGHWPW